MLVQLGIIWVKFEGKGYGLKLETIKIKQEWYAGMANHGSKPDTNSKI